MYLKGRPQVFLVVHYSLPVGLDWISAFRTMPIPSAEKSVVLAIYAPMIYTAPCIMFWMRAYPLRGEVGGGWALEFESYLGPVKWHRELQGLLEINSKL